MSGNVYEWCKDLYKYDFYKHSNSNNPVCNNDTSGYRVLRGGSWYYDSSWFLCSSSRIDVIDFTPVSFRNDGFRCVMDG